jgi:hypothetical protein
MDLNDLERPNVLDSREVGGAGLHVVLLLEPVAGEPLLGFISFR